MPTLNIEGNLLSDTEANWGADATVYTDKQMLISTDAQYGSTDQNKFKLADGVQTWTNLDYMPIAEGGNPISDQIFFNVNNVALADSFTYYLGQTTIYATGATSLAHIPLPSGTLTAVEIITWTTNTSGAEESTLTLIHAGGSLVLSSTLTFNSRNNFINLTGLSEIITAGGAYLTLVTPVFAVNPGNSQVRTHLKIEV